MSEHTPGPWEWFQEYGRVYLATPDRGRLYVMGFKRLGMNDAQPAFAVWEGEARGRFGGIMHPASELDLSKNPDARLIAAAPDLLEACKAARDWRGLDGDGISDPTRLALIAAIAKAEGREA